MALADDKFPSSAVFDRIQAALSASEQVRTAAINQARAVFAIKLRSQVGVESWYIDLKDKGQVYRGEPEKATTTLSLSDDDFGALVAGKANAQRLFMSGKLKIAGDLMKSTKLQAILQQANAQPQPQPLKAKL